MATWNEKSHLLDNIWSKTNEVVLGVLRGLVDHGFEAVAQRQRQREPDFRERAPIWPEIALT